MDFIHIANLLCRQHSDLRVLHSSGVDALQEHLSVCIDEVFSWMMSKRLQLNPFKTEVPWCSSARRQH